MAYSIHPNARARLLQETLIEGLRGRRLAEYQAQKRAELVDHARVNARRYRDYPSGSEAVKDWANLPILSRADIQQDLDGLSTRLIPAEAGKAAEAFTSGSSGKPLRFVKTPLFDRMNRISTLRLHAWWKIDPALSFLTIRMPRTAEERAAGAFRKQALAATGGFEYTTFDLDTGRALERLRELTPGYLRAYPNIVGSLAAEAARSGFVPPLRLVLTIGETVTDELRAEVRRAWGVAIADAYGAEETGLIAIQCPLCGHYHSCGETAFTEILREDGRPARPGETGRVVVTPLFNAALPLIRYDTGDAAEVIAPPPHCEGRGPALRAVMGRRKQMFHRPGGGRYWPALPSRELADAGVRQFCLTETAVGMLTLEYALFPDRHETPELRDMLRSAVRLATSADTRVTLQRVEAFPVAGAGKFLAYRSLPAEAGA